MKTSLFVLGLVLEMAGFFIGRSEEIPVIVKVVARGYIRANKAVERLGASESVRPGEPGFDELAQLILEEPNAPSNCEIREFVPGHNVTLEILGAVGQQNTEVQVKFSNGQTGKTSVMQLRPLLDKLRRRILFRWAIRVFTLGVILQIFGFLLDRRQQSGSV